VRLTRRHMLEGLCALTLSVAAMVGLPGDAAAQDAEMIELMKAGPLGERTLGKPEAPVTIVEYASLTCSHCARFHEATFPQLKEKYIDTGKVYFVFRDFPINVVARAAAMIARCGPENRYFAFIDLLFEQQRTWAFSDDPFAALVGMSKQAGFTQETVEACLTNQQVLDGVNWVEERAADKFKVSGTPTLFVNGERIVGAVSIEELEKTIKKHQ
jgi:protein-disulfide isomerase